MPKCEVIVTEAAQDDLIEIIEYIVNDNPTAAINLADEIENNILGLGDFPDMGAIPKKRQLAMKGYRILVVNNFLVFYVVVGVIVEIRRIISSKRNYARLF